MEKILNYEMLSEYQTDTLTNYQNKINDILEKRKNGEDFSIFGIPEKVDLLNNCLFEAVPDFPEVLKFTEEHVRNESLFGIPVPNNIVNPSKFIKDIFKSMKVKDSFIFIGKLIEETEGKIKLIDIDIDPMLYSVCIRIEDERNGRKIKLNIEKNISYGFKAYEVNSIEIQTRNNLVYNPFDCAIDGCSSSLSNNTGLTFSKFVDIDNSIFISAEDVAPNTLEFIEKIVEDLKENIRKKIEEV